jgi:NADH:ubiquinone oxidoreductase subunit K
MNSDNLLILSFILFISAISIFLTHKNLLMILMSLELGLNSANIALINFSFVKQSLEPMVWVFILFAIAACEAVIGLSILIMILRNFKTLKVDEIKDLKEI